MEFEACLAIYGSASILTDLRQALPIFASEKLVQPVTHGTLKSMFFQAPRVTIGSAAGLQSECNFQEVAADAGVDQEQHLRWRNTTI